LACTIGSRRDRPPKIVFTVRDAVGKGGLRVCQIQEMSKDLIWLLKLSEIGKFRTKNHSLEETNVLKRRTRPFKVGWKYFHWAIRVCIFTSKSDSILELKIPEESTRMPR
jgi:hypothetical protein